MTATPSRPETVPEPTAEVDGYTGPHADSLAAKEAFEQVAGVSPVIASDASLSTALSSLRGIIDRIKTDEQGNASSTTYSTELPLPSWEDAQRVLQKIERKLEKNEIPTGSY